MYNEFGYIRVGAIVPKLEVANVEFNRIEIEKQLKRAEENKISIVCTPELSMTGYTCQDLFNQDILLKESINQLGILIENTKTLNIVYIVGIPIKIESQLFNCAVVIQKGVILGIVPKTLIPNKREFQEKRWFTSAKNLSKDEIDILGKTVSIGTNLIFEDYNNSNFSFAIEICEDLWGAFPPSTLHTQKGANIIFNLSASNELIGKKQYRNLLIENQSAKTISGYVYVSSGVGESTTDMVFSGHSVISENGKILVQNKIFDLESNIIYSDIDTELLSYERMHNSNYEHEINNTKYKIINFNLLNNIENLYRSIDPEPFIPKTEQDKNEIFNELIQIQSMGLAKRLLHTKISKTVIGLSGGLDSTLAFLAIIRTYQVLKLDTKQIIAVSMPGFGTSEKTLDNAKKLANAYEIMLNIIDIKELCNNEMKAINFPENDYSTTYENIQARKRTEILMNLANKEKGLVIGTGDLSELALGWGTYNGDLMSMYSINSGIPKTLVKHYVKWLADRETPEKRDVLLSILKTPISPELLPTEDGNIKQKTEEILGDYKLHDFFLYHFIRYGQRPKKIYELAKLAFKDVYEDKEIKDTLSIFLNRFFNQQFKKNCIPDGPKVGTVALGPKSSWRMPSDAEVNLWIKDLQ